jgi:hypothetical protein
MEELLEKLGTLWAVGLVHTYVLYDKDLYSTRDINGEKCFPRSHLRLILYQLFFSFIKWPQRCVSILGPGVILRVSTKLTKYCFKFESIYIYMYMGHKKAIL